jgi:hypothetical protein
MNSPIYKLHRSFTGLPSRMRAHFQSCATPVVGNDASPASRCLGRTSGAQSLSKTNRAFSGVNATTTERQTRCVDQRTGALKKQRRFFCLTISALRSLCQRYGCRLCLVDCVPKIKLPVKTPSLVLKERTFSRASRVGLLCTQPA